ncbi:DUF3592 domain-containing protein [Hymenobacter terrestris]|uniref:DUF3592 domain-containing protein n=1 Tax=Hymenobacter terrestris TaxID=2748310 RepID=A0ABX2Q4C7_9BACT|nr:DUF3592 domain-containing protein [Hymenobacter terrestris]NVO85823.1 DUF3592 domain-containing protein [Hymenobacter terrestris]
MTTSQFIFLLVVLAIPAAMAYSVYRKKRWFQTHGVLVTGTVLKLVEDEADHETTAHYPVIRFLTEQHGWIVARYNVDRYPARYQVNQLVQLRYDPRYPTVFLIGAEPFGVRDWWPYALFAAIICCGFYVSLNH